MHIHGLSLCGGGGHPGAASNGWHTPFVPVTSSSYLEPALGGGTGEDMRTAAAWPQTRASVRPEALGSGEQGGSACLQSLRPGRASGDLSVHVSVCLLPYKGGCKASPGPDPTVWYQGGKSRKLRIFVVLNRPNVAILLTA